MRPPVLPRDRPPARGLVSSPAHGIPNPVPTDLPRRLVAGLLCYLAAAATLHLVWIVTAEPRWITAFRGLNAVFLIACAVLAAWQALAARGHFAPGDSWRTVWTLLASAALLRACGHVVTHGLAWPAPHAPDGLAQVGRVVAGPASLALLAIGLAAAIGIYRRRGLFARAAPTATDIVLAALVCLFAAQFLYDLVIWRRSIALRDGLLDIVSWSSDPLLALLLVEAIVIRRAAVRMGAGYFSALLDATMIRREHGRLGAGYVSRCWGAFAAGILLMAIGDMGQWASAREAIAWPWISLFWYVWPMAETAFAVAPAWQVIAARAAQEYERLPAGSSILRPRV